ncbi:uncharacterized protein [Solanum tuberosum]|uniref:Uncharacterized protein n=1 Tax=Solanum tuberosum TaxID=4113 RepID=M1BMG2_SOLTU|nr:PREDICTED: uncharacterized protein LOC102594114 isoform X2 [Solanum tuberosum]
MASLRREPEEREADLLSSPPSLSLSPLLPRPVSFFSGQQQPEQCSDQRQQRLVRCMTAVATAPSSQAKPSTPQNQQPAGTRGGNTSAFLFSSPSPLSLYSSDYDISNNSSPAVASEVEFIKDRSLQICPRLLNMSSGSGESLWKGY